MQSFNKNESVMRGNFQKKEKVPLKLSAVKKTELPLAQHPSEIAEPVVIAITCGSRSTQLVISRPIGVTPFDPKADWVITPIEEIETAIAFASDPGKDKKEAAKQKLRSDALTTSGDIVLKDGRMYFAKWEDGKDIASIYADASRAFNESKQSAKEKYLADCASKNQKPKRDWKFGMDLNHFIPKEVKEHQAELDKKLVSNAAYQEKLKSLNGYETLVGTNRDTRQRKLNVTENLSAEQLIDIIKRKLIHVMTVAPPSNSAQPQAAKSDNKSETPRSSDGKSV